MVIFAVLCIGNPFKIQGLSWSVNTPVRKKADKFSFLICRPWLGIADIIVWEVDRIAPYPILHHARETFS